MKYSILSPGKFPDYELLDSGNGQKLERFGKNVLIRPESQALWKPQLEWSMWKQMAHARFEAEDNQKGKWHTLKKHPNPWRITYKSSSYSLSMELKLTQFKHVGIFPEQCSHWDYIYSACRSKGKEPKVLNLFAYTGASSLAAKAAGADVVHCEALKQLVGWAKHNMEMSKLSDIRWLIEDAMKFAIREVKRAHLYDGIILDPPTFGNGPKGERFSLDHDLKQLVHLVSQLLKPSSFMVFNSYSFKYSALTIKNMFESEMGEISKAELGELAVKSGEQQSLPLGIYYRFNK